MTTTPGISAVHLHAAITSTRAMFTNSPEAQAALARVEFMMDIIPAQQAIQHQARADVAEADQAARQPLTPQQIDKIENRMIASLLEPLSDDQRTAMREYMVADFRELNAMGVQP